jgi:transposase InsO family protein
MTDFTIGTLVDTRKRIIKSVIQKQLTIKSAAQLLALTRQGVWKIVKRVEKGGMTELNILGHKRGPKLGALVWNKTSDEIEKKVEDLWCSYDVGVDTLTWIVEDLAFIKLSRSTVYRILLRRQLLIKTNKPKHRKDYKYYSKGFPGEEIQIDTTEPFGKGKGIMITAIDDCTRWTMADLYKQNTSLNAANFVEKLYWQLPFPIKSFRTDNGSEFKKDFINVCKKLNINIIRNPPHSPTKNGKVERMHQTIETECFWRLKINEINDEIETKYWLNRYLAYYNHKRRHSGFAMHLQTPLMKLENWLYTNLNTLPDYREADVNETMIRYMLMKKF